MLVRKPASLLTFAVFAGVLPTACSSNSGEVDQAAMLLRGITVPGEPGLQEVFLGRRADLIKQLDDVKAGVFFDEAWYRIEVPDALMPDTDKVASLDIAATSGLRFHLNRVWPEPGAGEFWAIHTHRSGDPGLSGRLDLAGATAVSEAKAMSVDSNVVGIAFRLQYSGPPVQVVTKSGTRTIDAHGTTEVGALVSKLNVPE